MGRPDFGAARPDVGSGFRYRTVQRGLLGALLALSVVVPGIAVAGPRSAATVPANTSPPAISGTPQVGSTLS
ncbi:MAG: hypothetical protein M3290_13140, partial [Actinomycetota bacterium]|nr:hypothetical protein [Actinomycetota bacterium]